jgi:hypothetical protein
MAVAELFFLRLLISVAVVHAFQVPPPRCCDKQTQQRQWIAAASSSSTTTTTCWDNNLEPLEGIDQPFVQSQWMMSSVVERALLHQDVSVNPYALLEQLDMSSSERDRAIQSLERTDAILTRPLVLTQDECSKLRTFVRKQIKNDGIDQVDGCPDWQVNISEKKLIRIIGKDARDRLWKVPSILDPDEASGAECFDRVGIFIRMYQRGTRPWMPFHRDGNQWTVNVALNRSDEFAGGRLLALHNHQMQVIERDEGDATCHDDSVFHAVSAITEGTRYSMILFFHRRSVM